MTKALSTIEVQRLAKKLESVRHCAPHTYLSMGNLLSYDVLMTSIFHPEDYGIESLYLRVNTRKLVGSIRQSSNLTGN